MTGRSAPAASRNRGPILDVLNQVLPRTGLVLEIASGTGEHALWFSAALPHLVWQPTDHDDEALASISAWREAGPTNLRPPVRLDAACRTWPIAHAEAIVSVNMIHIAPWAAAEGLAAASGRILPPGGVVVLYGPFREAPVPLAAGNAAFDADLRARDPAWGLRERDAVVALMDHHGLAFERRIAMPANNLVLVFRRR